ncbi:MAG: glucose-6-phosphate dehydrogenase assembly protein OpcA [Spirulinaceae cyanobacterium]
MVLTKSAPIVSLQTPKDVSIDDIESELQEIWQNYGGEDGSATRATTFSFIVYEPDGTQQLLAALGFYQGAIDGIAGPRTAAAIKAAQKKYQLEVTGKSHADFLKRLEEEFAKAKEQDQLTSENETAAIKYSPDLEGAGIADAIAVSNPCRIITLCPIAGEDQGVEAQVSAYCPIQKRNKNSSLICCEYITLRGTAEALERIGGVISALLISGLPKYIWWKATPDPEYGLFKRLTGSSDTIIFDSSSFMSPEADLTKVGQLLEQKNIVADLNWGRLAAWQELAAEAFDPPERRADIKKVDRVTIDYEKGNQSQALMYLGWLASRLKWQPVSFVKEGGDYDIRRIKFTTDEQVTIEAELAGIPTADWGDVPGDLTSLRLTSTDLDADCCTVLCSETTGCMRMESGGGAQSCRIQQVTPLFDQKTEDLLSGQLQRWGQDTLYQESMEVTYKILQLLKEN